MQAKMILCALFAALFLQGCATSPGMASELQQGKLTFESGDYNKAFHQLLPVAISGKKEAQYAVGYMYYNGLGVAADSEAGKDWMKRSAEQGYGPAINALKTLSTH